MSDKIKHNTLTFRRYPRTEREAFQARNNPPLAPRHSQFYGEFAVRRRVWFWKMLQSLLFGS
jgi:hypothetical protein